MGAPAPSIVSMLEAALAEAGLYQRLYRVRRKHPELADDLDEIARAVQRAVRAVESATSSEGESELKSA